MMVDLPAVGRRGRSVSYRRYWLALYRRDVAEAERVVARCLREWRPHRVYTEMFEPALNLSGAMFATGRITYRDEHFVTHHTLRLLRQVRRRLVQAEPTGPLALATGVGQESHLIGLRMVCDFLQRDNWRTHFLTSNDRGVLRRAVATLNPAAVLLSLGSSAPVVPARRMIAELRRMKYPGLVVIGGKSVNEDPSLVHKLGADLTACNGPALARALRTRSSPAKFAWAFHKEIQ